MKKLFAFSALVGLALNVQAQDKKIEFTEYDLDNGMHVILHQDKTTPIVAVSVMYHVGSKNENTDKTGFAHFFEHLLFEGTANISRGEYSELVEKNGGTLNANTSQDRTYYYEILPSNQLELGMWLESERLLHAKVDIQGIETQREVVKEEKRQRMDNQPYGSFMANSFSRVYKEHPYRWVPIGSMEHLDAAVEEDYVNFYRTFYVPSNAVLSIAGDINIEDTKELVNKYFASIPKGQAINMYRDFENLSDDEFKTTYGVEKLKLDANNFMSPKDKAAKAAVKKYAAMKTVIPRPDIKEKGITAPIVDTIYDNIQLPGVFACYQIPAQNSKEFYALQYMNTILSGGSSSRMTKNIVERDELATAAFSFSMPLEDESMGLVAAIGAKDISVEDIQKALDSEIKRIQDELVSEEEFQKAKNQFENSFYSSNGSIAGVAENLANNYMYFGNTDLINSELEKYNEITRADVQAVAKKYYDPNKRVILYYLPKPANN